MSRLCTHGHTDTRTECEDSARILETEFTKMEKRKRGKEEKRKNEKRKREKGEKRKREKRKKCVARKHVVDQTIKTI